MNYRQHPHTLNTVPKIMLVEDELAIAEPLAFLLGKENIDVTIHTDGTEALAAYRRAHSSPHPYDLILLDLMLPGLSGLDICRTIRAESTTPIIMLTAKDTELDRVLGLEIGADDYITKPYFAREVLARIRAVLRRHPTPATDAPDLPDTAPDILTAHGIHMDIDRHTLTVRGHDIHVPLREYQLLEILMRNQGFVLTRETLIDRIWGPGYVGDTKTLDVHIKRIRARIEEDPRNPQLISTVRGVGYKFG